jgi:hypothetical protein
MCKQELWVSQDGATHRVDAALPSGMKLRLGIAACAVAGVCMIGALGLWAIKVGMQNAALKPEPAVSKSSPRMLWATGPDVCAKPSMSPNRAKAKPAPAKEATAVVEAPAKAAVVKAAGYIPAWAKPVSKGDGAAIAGAPLFGSEQDLDVMLREVPTVDLDPNYQNNSKESLAATAQEIAKANKNAKDAFIKKMLTERQDLAGLPFLLGKDCALDAKPAQSLAGHSLSIRSGMAMAHEMVRQQTKDYSSRGRLIHVDRNADPVATTFWSEADSRSSLRLGLSLESLNAFQQIMSGENAEFRRGFIDRLEKVKGARASQILVNRALFDLDPNNRQAALALLAGRPVEEYGDALKNALRYPWRPVVENALRAVVFLDRKEMAPHLKKLLDEPDPEAVFTVKDKDGKAKEMVRELVRINHHRNCMLCHAAVDPTDKAAMAEVRSLPVGPIPSPQESLPPPSTTVYYSVRPGITVVRADVTYLKQDFSVSQPVSETGRWPQMQRFDFLVRTREVTPHDLARRAPDTKANYRKAITDALGALSGKEAPRSAAMAQAVAQEAPRARAKGSR